MMTYSSDTRGAACNVDVAVVEESRFILTRWDAVIAGDLVALLHCPEREHEDTRVIRVEGDHGVARVLIGHACQRIEMRNRSDEQPVLAERRVELHRLEEIARAG